MMQALRGSPLQRFKRLRRRRKKAAALLGSALTIRTMRKARAS